MTGARHGVGVGFGRSAKHGQPSGPCPPRLSMDDEQNGCSNLRGIQSDQALVFRFDREVGKMFSRCGFLLFAVFATIGAGILSGQSHLEAANEISRIRNESVTNWNAGHLGPIVKVFEKDAVLLPSTGQRIVGRSAIENYLKQVMDSSPGKLSVSSTSVKESGNRAYDRGTFQYSANVPGVILSGGVRISGGATISGGGGTREWKGNYLSIYKRGADHKWLIQRQTFAQTLPGQH